MNPADSLLTGHCYWITYQCRDIGYGTETGHGEYVYRGPSGHWGKHEFTPANGGPAIYLFPDDLTLTITQR